MAGAEGRTAALNCALETIEPRQLLFGTDYPQDFTGATTDSGVGPAGMRTYVDTIRALNVTREQVGAMLAGNAQRHFLLARERV